MKNPLQSLLLSESGASNNLNYSDEKNLQNLQMKKPPWQADDGSTHEAVDAREPISPLNFNIHTIKLITRRATRHVLPI